MSRRFQFSLKWLFVAMLVVAAFFGGMSLQRRLEERKRSALIVDLDLDGDVDLDVWPDILLSPGK